jgi:hypothetical protein
MKNISKTKSPFSLAWLVPILCGLWACSEIQAAVPDANGVITACYQKKLGTVRVIDTAKIASCKPKEIKFTWNAQGVKGDQGIAGIPGTSGAPGTAGEAAVLNFLGEWSNATTYNATDMVSFLGSSYISLQANNLNNTPDAKPQSWGILAKRGDAGTIGLAGPAGPPGPQGTPGKDSPVHFIGDLYQGGMVFYVDADGKHGLIAALADQTAGIQWFNGINKVTGASGDGIGAGAMNTAILVATQIGDNQSPASNFAAKAAANYRVQENGTSSCSVTPVATETCYGGWYLPSRIELYLLYQQRNIMFGFTTNQYWSSTESDVGTAWTLGFFGGTQDRILKGFSNVRVRAIRAF